MFLFIQKIIFKWFLNDEEKLAHNKPLPTQVRR